MTYKDEITKANTELAKDPKTRFIGYGLKKGRAMGTLNGVEESQIIEMPVAENLLLGSAIGMALTGLKPVVFIERMDFLMNCMDALVNHLDKIKEISQNEFDPSVIIRCVVGNVRKPLYTGLTHTQDFSRVLRGMTNIPVYQLGSEDTAKFYYELAIQRGGSAIIVEYKDLM